MILQWSHSLGLNGSFIRLDAYCHSFISLTSAHSTKCILIYNRTLNQSMLFSRILCGVSSVQCWCSLEYWSDGYDYGNDIFTCSGSTKLVILGVEYSSSLAHVNIK